MSVPEQQVTVGFVGLGNMGWPMATNLHEAGFRLVVRDIEAAKQDRFAAEHPGAVAAASPDAFAPAGLVVTMLPNGAIVRDAMLGWGIAAALRDGALLVEMSSSDPSDTLLLAAGLGPLGVRMVDAPVSGGVPRSPASWPSWSAARRPTWPRLSQCCACSATRPGSSRPAGWAAGTR
jgi:3-hydroxyisobutyrate dehydrogenase